MDLNISEERKSNLHVQLYLNNIIFNKGAL